MCTRFGNVREFPTRHHRFHLAISRIHFYRKKSIGEELEDIYNESTEPYIGINTMIQPVLLIRDPKIIKDILIKGFQSFAHRGFNANVDVDPMADNILLHKEYLGQCLDGEIYFN